MGARPALPLLASALIAGTAAVHGVGCAPLMPPCPPRLRGEPPSAIDSSAETLASEILGSPAFARWRDQHVAERAGASIEGVDVLGLGFENGTQDPAVMRLMEQICADLSRHLLNGQVRLRCRTGDETSGGFDWSSQQPHEEALPDSNWMDHPSYDDHGSGRQSQGGHGKAVLGLMLRVVSDDHDGPRDFVIRAILIDGRTKREVVSARVTLPAG